MEASVALYKKRLRERGLKSTHQRDLIVQEFFRKHQHLTVEELLAKVRGLDPTIGFATVYRTLKLLTDLELALKREFGGGRARFEQVTHRHHDHLICTDCGSIVEFENDAIEKLQEKVCRKYRFQLIQHKMELYGCCEKCSAKKGKSDDRH